MGLSLLAASGSAELAAKGTAFPYRLGVRISHGGPSGPDATREDLRLGLMWALNNSGCYESVRLVEEPDSTTDLLLEVVIVEISEQTRYGISMATLNSPNAEPGTEKNVVAEVRGTFHVELMTVPEAALIRSRQFLQVGTHIPTLNEDPQAEARWEMLNEAVRSLRVFACKGSPKKLARSIEQARAEAAERD